MSKITLPKLRSLAEPEKEAPKLCGGDLHRARAPKPVDDGVGSYYERQAYKKPKAMRIYDPRKVANWTDEAIAEMNRLIESGLSRTQTAEALNQKFPQANDGVRFTAGALAGKLARQKARETK